MRGRCGVDERSMRGRCGVDEGSIIIYEGERPVTPPSPIFYKRGLKVCFLSDRVRFKSKMWNSSHHYNLLQQRSGNYEDSEESDFSQENEVSKASCGTASSQEETESLVPWSRIFDEAEKRHETQLNALINDYEGNGE